MWKILPGNTSYYFVKLSKMHIGSFTLSSFDWYFSSMLLNILFVTFTYKLEFENRIFRQICHSADWFWWPSFHGWRPRVRIPDTFTIASNCGTCTERCETHTPYLSASAPTHWLSAQDCKHVSLTIALYIYRGLQACLFNYSFVYLYRIII